MLYRAIIPVCSIDPHKTLKYIVWAERSLLNVKAGSTCSKHEDLGG